MQGVAVTLVLLGSPCAPTCSGELGLSLANILLTLNPLLHGWRGGPGHTSVLLGNDCEEKQKFAARVIVKGFGPHPFFIFSSYPFFSVTFISAVRGCQLSRTCCPQMAPWGPSGVQLWSQGTE